MNRLRLVVIGLMGITVLAVGVAMARRGEAPGERERFDKLFAEGNFKDAYEGYRRLALDPKTEPDRVGTDLRRAIECLVQLGRVDEVDAFREAVVAVHQGNWRLLQAAAESYLNDVTALRLHRRRQVPPRPASRRRAIRRLVRARSVPRLAAPGPRAGSRAVGPRSRRGGPLPADARPGPAWATGTQSDSWRLQSLTPLDVLPDYDENPYRSLGRPAGRAHPSSPTGRRSITGSPRASRRPRTTASAGGGHSPRPPKPTPACSTRPARRWPVSCSASSAPRPSPGRRSAARSAEGRPEAVRPLCARHPHGRRDDRPAGHRHQAVQAPRRVQLRSRSTRRSPTIPRPARAKRPSTRWRRSSRTAASSTGPPST